MSRLLKKSSGTDLKQKRSVSFAGKSIQQVKLELTAQLNEKEKALEKTGMSPISRNALIKQTEAIKAEINALDGYQKEDELPTDVRLKLEDLANEFQGLKGTKSTGLDDVSPRGPSTSFSPLLPPPPTNSSPTKRTKTVNGNKRNPDIEFATEIGQNLLNEVRKLHTDLQEKEEIIKQLQSSQANAERLQESVERQLKQREEIEERLKEENWNLEVANQELRSSLLESNQAIAKHNTEFSKLAKQLKNQSEQIEIMKAQEEKSTSVIEAMKARHEQETYQLRKHAANAQRENTQAQKQVEALQTELKIHKAKLAIRMTVSSRTDETKSAETTQDDDQDQDRNQDQTNTKGPVLAPSVSQSSRSQALETETLKQSLAHAHRIISNLRSSIHKEKVEKFELKKMLSDSQENIEQMRKEMASWNQNNAMGMGGGQGRSKSGGKRKGKSAKKRRGGVGRQPRGLVANDSDAELKSISANEETEEEEEDELSSETGDEEDSMHGDALDPEFSFVPAGNTLGSFMEFSSAPFGSNSMKPLSSELELNSKTETVDVGINTETVDPTPLDHPLLVQEQISQALVRERRAIFERAQPILSAEQIQVILPNRHLEEHNVQDTQDTTQYTEKEVTHAMIPKSDVDRLVQEAIETKTATMIPKLEADERVHKARQETRFEVEQELSLSMIPKAEAEVMVHEAMQKTRGELEVAHQEQLRDMVVKADGRVQEAVATTTEQLRQAFDSEKKKIEQDMVTKIKAADMVQEATENLRSEFEQEKKQRDEEERVKLNKFAESLTNDMISKQDAEKLAQKAALEERGKVETEMNKWMDKQKSEIEASKQAKVEQLEVAHVSALEIQKSEMMAVQKAELERFSLEMSTKHKTELEEQEMKLKMSQTEELNKQRLEIEAVMGGALEKLKVEMEATQQAALEKCQSESDSLRLSELERQKAELEEAKVKALDQQKEELEALKVKEIQAQQTQWEATKAELEAAEAARMNELQSSKKTEIDALSKRIESYKKEQEETLRRMKNMLTKESVDVLVKRAVAEVQEAAEKNQAEALAGMISKEYAKRMVEDEVAKALEAERKEVAEREAAESLEMISKAEAEALAKVAAADAIVKERQAAAARESELVTKEEVKVLTETAVREALEKERAESAAVLTKERKMFKEKEEQMITKEQAEKDIKHAVQQALAEYQQTHVEEKPSHALAHLSLKSETPKPSRSKTQRVSTTPSELAPEISLERSVSTSRINLPSVNVTPAPSASTPAHSSRRLRLSSSVSSLRLGHKKDGDAKLKTEANPSNSSFGSLRILDKSKYQSHRLQSRSTASLREVSNKQHSTISVSTMSSGDDQTVNQVYSEEGFSGFPSGGATDAYIISAITQTMIGEWMSKHTRRYVGGGISENKHKRYFWVHPYTKILYWSPEKPGAEGNQAKTKSAYIESLSVVPSHDHTGASTISLLIHTPKRDLKITAPSSERHDIWYKSLSYLLGRSTEPEETSTRLTNDSSSTIDNAGHQQGTKPSDMNVSNDAEVTQYDSDESEDLVNIRQCCDGKHDLSTLSRGHHHHH
ncbi:hypothetical protein EDC96DRAFT_509460 [Choanephora cucurbitarum]|nr:hypothetical protein EDC96DRAFT_509460 [Choanephora cucurbitarum]